MLRRNRHPLTCLFAAMLLCSVWCAAPVFGTGLDPAPVNSPIIPQYVPAELASSSIDEHPGARLPVDAAFIDENGRPVRLGQYFGGKKPVVLQLGYFGCPMLCGLVTQGLLDSLKEVGLNAGTDYDVISLSIDPAETPTLAKQKKQSYIGDYGRPGTEGGWHFLTGQEEQIHAVTRAVGFNYQFVESVRQFSHPAVVFICMPDGKVSRYLYGVKFEPKTVRLSLVEASDGKVGTTTDRFLLTCFRYDGHQGKYALAAVSLMRGGGILTVLVLAGVLLTLFRREGHFRAAKSPGFEVQRRDDRRA